MKRQRVVLPLLVAMGALQWAAACGDDGVEPEPNRAPEAVNSIPAAQLTPGEIVAVDMSAYFSDPDGDTLSYEAATSAAGVATVSVSGSVVTVEAVAKGSATVTVTASDPDGDALHFTAESSSPEVATAAIAGTRIELEALGWGTAAVTVTARDPGGLTAQLEFSVTVEPPSPRWSICDRTTAVRDMILALTGADDCASVKGSELASISRLGLANAGITSLKPDDFEGLTGLTGLELFGNSLEVPPSDVFTPDCRRSRCFKCPTTA